MNGMMPTPTDKIRSRHRDRLALVYVRQSTLQQVERHQESTRLQYGLVERALELGWPRERVEIIDDDLGRSGTSAEGRPGFQRLVAEVGLGRVGLVLGVEMSRLARSCCDGTSCWKFADCVKRSWPTVTVFTTSGVSTTGSCWG
jgi:hypothetical protein